MGEATAESEEQYRLSMWGCLSCVLEEYGVDYSKITGRIGEHMVADFMELLEKHGYVGRCEG